MADATTGRRLLTVEEAAEKDRRHASEALRKLYELAAVDGPEEREADELREEIERSTDEAIRLTALALERKLLASETKGDELRTALAALRDTVRDTLLPAIAAVARGESLPSLWAAEEVAMQEVFGRVDAALADTITCATCGQPFDPADLDAVVYHEQDPHRPQAFIGDFRGVRVDGGGGTSHA